MDGIAAELEIVSIGQLPQRALCSAQRICNGGLPESAGKKLDQIQYQPTTLDEIGRLITAPQLSQAGESTFAHLRGISEQTSLFVVSRLWFEN